MTIANTSTPVTVLPSPHPVFNVDPSRWCPSFFSRYSKGWFVYDLDAISAVESLEALKNEALKKIAQRIDEVSFFAWDDPLPADVYELFSNRRSEASTVPPFDLKSAAELKSTAAPPEKQACL